MKIEIELLMRLNNTEGFIRGLAVKTENGCERENLISYAKSLHECVENLIICSAEENGVSPQLWKTQLNNHNE